MSGLPDAEVPDEAEGRAAFLLRLRAAGIRDIDVLRAMEAVPRTAFLPDAVAGYAMRDIALPLPFGQTAERPSQLARAIEALGCRKGDHVLEVGSGSGYGTALLATMGAVVTGRERYRGLVEAATVGLRALGCDEAEVVWADGLRPPAGSFPRIIVHVTLLEPPAALLAALDPDGILVYGRRDRAEARQCRLVRVLRETGGALSEEDAGPSFLAPVMPGRSRLL